jgi:hypothetical protein
MRISKLGWAVVGAAAIAAMQAAALAAPSPLISFSAGGSTQTLPQLTDDNPVILNGANSGNFTADPGSNSILTVTGGFGSYVPQYVNGINNTAAGGVAGDSSNYLKIAGFDPSTDNIYVALKIDNNGVYVNPTSNATLVNTIISDINADTSDPNYDGPLASTVSGQFEGIFPGYDILLSFPTTFDPASPARPVAGSPEQFDFGFNFSGYTDTGVTGAGITVTDIGLVPEPGCLGLLTAAALLLPRYRRRT